MLESLPGYDKQVYSDLNYPVNMHFDSLGASLLVQSHWHEEIELLFIVKGKINLFCDRFSAEAEAGDVVCIPSNLVHKMENIDEPCDYYCALIKPAFLQGFNTTALPPYPIISKEENIASLMDTVISEHYQKNEYYSTIVHGALLSVLSLFMRYNTTSSSNPIRLKVGIQANRLQPALSYIHEHFTEKITIQQMCELTNFSKPHFCKNFRQMTGTSLVEYLNKLRCEYALHLIQSNDYTISQCAELCGFHNLSYFTRRYKEYFGYLPSQTPDKNA